MKYNINIFHGKSLNNLVKLFAVRTMVMVCAFAGSSLALMSTMQSQETASNSDSTTKQEAQQKKNFEKFEKLLANVKLVGSFTIVGSDDKTLREEEYVIEKVTKLKEGDKWRFEAQIKFGEYDFSAPLDLDVFWAGDTPVITLTDVTIPTLGTFSSRVLFVKGKYAGTWTHDDKGGHMFGRIVPNDKDGDDKSDNQSNDDSAKKKDSDKKSDK